MATEQGRGAGPPRRAPASPCIDVCRLNERGLCEGCLRSIDEITGWSGMTAEEQWRVLERIELRRSGVGLP